MTQNRTITDKDHYHELTPKQQAVVDAIAAEPDAIQQEIADRASQELANDPDTDVDSVNRSYVSVVKNKYEHIINQQKAQYDNQRGPGGEESAEGNTPDALDRMLGNDSRGTSMIQDRDVKQTQSTADTQEEATESADTAESQEGEIPVTLTRDEAMELATSGCSESFQKRLAAMLVENSAKVSA